jgi:cytochrome c-type biogenesis protein
MSGLPIFTLAFASGMASALNPCGIGLLPAYLGHLGTRFGVRHPLLHSLEATVWMAVSFVVVFALLGSALRVLGSLLFQLAPGLSLLVASALVAVGALTLAGRKPTFILRQWQVHGRGYVGATLAYGFSFAVCSLSCTLPVFLSVALQATTLGAGAALLAFLLFALGMAFVILPISLAGTFMADRLRAWLASGALPAVERASGVLMILSGLYLTWYWLLGPEHLLHA